MNEAKINSNGNFAELAERYADPEIRVFSDYAESGLGGGMSRCQKQLDRGGETDVERQTKSFLRELFTDRER